MDGVCFGYRVRGPVQLRYLRTGPGDSELAVCERDGPDPSPAGAPVASWPAAQRGGLAGRLHRDGQRFHLWVDGGGWFDVEPCRPRITVPAATDALRREERLWGVPALLCFSARGDLPLHAAAVEVDGGAVLLAGPSRAGKTSLAAAFVRAGRRLLTEDLSCCRMAPEPELVPGPAMLRLRPDAYGGVPPDGMVVVGRDDERVHLALADSDRAGCPVPIRGLAVLRSSRDTPAAVPLAAPTALPELWALTFVLPDPASRAQRLEQLLALVDAVPVWDLHVPRGLHRLPAAVTTLTGVLG